jgi:hypothetical protein
MSIPNMAGGLIDCIILLEKGIVFNNLSITTSIIKEQNLVNKRRPNIVLRKQIDNMDLRNCMVYIEEPWEDIRNRSHNIHEQGNWPLSEKEMQNKKYSEMDLYLWGKTLQVGQQTKKENGGN